MTATKICAGTRPLPQDLECVFREHYAFVYRTALRMTRNPSDAEDLVQDALVRAYRFYDRFEHGGSL